MMGTNRFEARKAETKVAIQQSFIALLNDKAFDEITVREISAQANIGFKTFYRHYQDKTELTNAMIGEFLELLGPQLEPPTTIEATIRNMRTILGVVHGHARTLHAIGQTPLRDTLTAPMVQFAFSEGVPLPITASTGDSERLAKRQEAVANHFVHAQLSLFYWWVADDLTLSLEEMAELITELIIRPIWTVSTSNAD